MPPPVRRETKTVRIDRLLPFAFFTRAGEKDPGFAVVAASVEATTKFLGGPIHRPVVRPAKGKKG